MKRGQCGTFASVDDLSTNDAREVERFAIFLRQVGQAKGAGLTAREAVAAVYPDTYGDDAAVPS